MGMDFQAFKFDFFTISQRSLLIIKLVANSLKQRIFVDTHDSHFVQCVSPNNAHYLHKLFMAIAPQCQPILIIYTGQIAKYAIECMFLAVLFGAGATKVVVPVGLHKRTK